MGRPKLHEERRVSTQVRLPESLHERLRLAAQDRDVSVNLVVTRALVEYLERLAPSEVVLATIRPDAYRQEVG
ncbi:MAG TPA: toxin-antitoxin system HicB family antitoxin [Acidimicrobiales bacterium]|nr:toxin-antitoxin system HicB family antitoxin [Acidimicrobiales bacterium]